MLNINQPRRFLLFWISWPIFIELFLTIFMRSADTFMLSFVSDEAVGAVGIANQIIYFTFIIFSVVSAGSAIVIAQYLGAGKQQKVISITSNAISVIFIFGFLFSLIIILNRKNLLSLFQLDESLLGLAQTYLLIVGCVISIQAMMMIMSAIIQAHGYTKNTMYIHIIINVLNIAGNYLFIFGAFGFPAWGVTGVAISTAFSQLVGFFAIGYILYKKVGVTLNWRAFAIWDKVNLKKILGIGAPAAAEHISYAASQIITTMFITMLGITVLTAKIYTQNIMAFIVVFLMAIGRGTQIIIGHQVGAGDVDKAFKQAYRSLFSGMAIALFIVTGMSIWGKSLLSIFTEDPNIITLGAALLLLGFILEPGRSFNVIIGHALRAAGDARFMMVISILSMWCISVPLAYYIGIHLGFGLYGIWAAYILDEWVRGLTLMLRWRSRKWEQKSLVDTPAEGQVSM